MPYFNYRIIISPDQETGTGKPGFSAFAPALGIADDGSTIEEAISNLNQAITLYLETLAEDGLEIPTDHPEQDIITTTKIPSPAKYKQKIYA